MKIGNMDFGPCMVMSGTQGFFGDGYPFHRYPFLRRWLVFDGTTFVAKTTTLNPHAGNTPYRDAEQNYEPQEFLPRSIWVTWWSWLYGFMLNSVGLSGPGAEALFRTMRWQNVKVPFMVSFMPVAGTRDGKLEEAREFVRLWKLYMPAGLSVALQLNLSCPNVKANFDELIQDAGALLDILSEISVPIVLKLNVLVWPEVAVSLSEHQHCAGLCVSNTLPFGEDPIGSYRGFDWKRWFPRGSPLAHIGGGGLSGKPLRTLGTHWVSQVFIAGLKKPINAGGGILHPNDVNDYVGAGLRRGIDSIGFGSVAALRPWRIRSIVERAHALLA